MDVLVDLFLNIIGDFLSFLQHILENELPTGVLQDGVGDLGDS